MVVHFFSILYNLIANLLAIWIAGAKENITSLWVGVVPHLVDEVYQSYNKLMAKYFFVDHDLEHAEYIKLLLNAFE